MKTETERIVSVSKHCRSIQENWKWTLPGHISF